MTGDTPDTQEDLYASLMAACDEAVAGNVPPLKTDEDAVSPDLRSEMQSHLACLRLLRHHWPRSHTAEPTADSVGVGETRLGRFSIRGELGQGSFGRVFLAYDPQLNREVALKVPRGDGPLTPDLRERFHREAKAAAGLDHPNIVQVYEAGEAGPISYIASAYCPGPTLAAWLKEQTEPVPPLLAAQLLADLAEAVQHAHSRGVLHRDLKPGNILLSSVVRRPLSAAADHQFHSAGDGPRTTDHGLIPKITDFGLAKIQSETAVSATQSGAILGTPQYMAPEQAGGRSQNIRAPADLYALGAIQYELLTGRPPFVADSVLEMLTQVKMLEPVSPRRLRPRLPRDLETICLKCLQKEPTKRYASAGDLARDLRRFLNGEPIHARAVGFWEHASKWAKRRPAVAALIATVAAVLSVGIVVSSLFAVWATAERDKARFELGNSLVAQGAALQRTGQIGQRFESLRLLGRAAQELRDHPEGRHRQLEIRNHAIAALGLTDLRTSWERPLGAVVGVQCDPELQRYAFVDLYGNGETRIRRLADDLELLTLPNPGVKFWHAMTDFSADGQYLLVCYLISNETNPLLHVWRLDRKDLVLAQRRGANNDLSMAAVIHPNGRWLVYVSPEKDVAVWDLIERREIRRHRCEGTPFNICLDSAGKRLAVAEFDSWLIRILDLETNEEIASWGSEVHVGSLSWSADDHLLAAGTQNGCVRIWSAAHGELLSVLEGHTNAVNRTTFASSGQLLATTGWDGTTRLWDAASGQALVVAPGTFCRFASDGGRLAFSRSDHIGVWDVAHHHECRASHPAMAGNRSDLLTTRWPYGAEFSPDGRLLATAGMDGARLWEVSSGRELARLPTGTCNPAMFDPDGQSLIAVGMTGVHRWPIRSAAGHDSEVLRIGPPELLFKMRSQPGHYLDARSLPGNRALAVLNSSNGRISIVDLVPQQARNLEPNVFRTKSEKTTNIAVSPDGQWLAAGGWKEPGIPIWNIAERRRLEPPLPPGDGRGTKIFVTQFSPDGRWLVSSTADGDCLGLGYYFWRVGSWERERHIPAELCLPKVEFTPDSRMMALSVTPQQILLADPNDGHELARLTMPPATTAWPGAFSRDGTNLAVITKQGSVYIWDLRRVRDRLADMSLDWNFPEYSSESVTQPLNSNPLQAQVVGEVFIKADE